MQKLRIFLAACLLWATVALGQPSLPAPPQIHVVPVGPYMVVRWNQVVYPGLSGYNVYWGATNGVYDGVAAVTPTTTTNAMIAVPAYGTYYITVTSVTTNNLESLYSPEIQFTLTPAPTNRLFTVQMMASTNILGPFANIGPPLQLTNPPAPQMFFKLSITETNY